MQGRLRAAGQCHHHRRQSLVTGGHSHHSVASGQGTNLAAEHLRSIVAVRQTVHHPRRALNASVARVGAKRREGQAVSHLEFLGSRLHQQSDFPVTGMVAKSYGSSICVPNAALSAQDQELLSGKLIWTPTHASVLAVRKEIAARGIAQHILCHRHPALWSGRLRLKIEDCGILGIENVV